MEELIKVHARHLADIEDFIWDNRDEEFACHLGIRSMCQVETIIQGFLRYLCKSAVQNWLADLMYFGANISDSSSESDGSRDSSSDSDDDEPLDNMGPVVTYNGANYWDFY